MPDSLQREEALDPTRSFIVEAPAGSGKTSLLVQRYLRLLSIADRPESVVAMTFTRKAAAELLERVLTSFDEAEEIEELDEYKKKTSQLAKAVLSRDSVLGWNIRTDTTRLQIQTIDSLCAMLTRQMPVVSRLGGSPNVVENAGDAYHLAARQTIRDLAEGKQEHRELFRRISLHFDNDLTRLECQVSEMLERREQWRALHAALQPNRIDAQDFCDLLGFAERELREVFRARGEVDFSEVTRAAIDALGSPESPSDLLYWLDYRIEHLLVDEFQDTSLAQYELLEKLTGQWSDGDGRTLFVVGDPMQSIYRFRQAEVGLFLECWKSRQLGAVRLSPLQLTSNFRSTPEIVEWTQVTFASIMTEDNQRNASVKLRPAEASRPPTGIEPKLIPFVNDKGREEAAEIVKLAQDSLPKGDVAILVRGRNHLAEILPALRDAGIRYEAVEIDQLQKAQHVLDLVSLTRAIVHLGDRVSWLACLRAPWCGLRLADLATLAEHEKDRTVLELLSDPDKIAGLSPEGRSRALNVADVLGRAVAHAGRCSLRILVEQSWMALGGPSVLREGSHRADVETYLDLIESFEEGGTIRDFSLLRERLEFLFAQPVSGADCVKIMTIHNAKGLEFDTVILPKLGAKAKRTDRDLIIWAEEFDDGVARFEVAAQPRRGAKDQLYESICKKLDQQEDEELKRLFYVATTRAKNRLYLLGNADAKKDRSCCTAASKHTFLGLIWPAVSKEFESLLRRKAWQQSSFFEQFNEPQNVLRRLPITWRTPRLDHSVHWEPDVRRATASARTIAYEWVSDTGRHIGTVVHEILKRVAREGPADWNEERMAAVGPIVTSELLRLGVSADEESRASGQVRRAVLNTVRSAKGRWILERHQDAQSEWAISGSIGDKLVNGTVDRVFRDGEGRWWIVDYKTSEHEGADLNKFLAEEERRYRGQLESYATLMARLVEGPISLGLYFPLLDAWRDWHYQSETAVSAL